MRKHSLRIRGTVFPDLRAEIRHPFFSCLLSYHILARRSIQDSAARVATLFIPRITLWLLDVAVPAGDTAGIGRMALLFVGVIALSITFTTIRSRMMAHVSQEIIFDIRTDLFAHLQKLPFSYERSSPASGEAPKARVPRTSGKSALYSPVYSSGSSAAAVRGSISASASAAALLS